MALANHRLAPDIEVISFITNEEHTFLSSTTVREIASLDGDVSSMVPPFVETALKKKVHGMSDSQRPANALRD
jgi:pantetheine-phosphate adenylyltransferase